MLVPLVALVAYARCFENTFPLVGWASQDWEDCRPTLIVRWAGLHASDLVTHAAALANLKTHYEGAQYPLFKPWETNQDFVQQQRQCPHTEIALRAVASSSTDRFDALQRDDVELGAALESFDGRVVIDARPDTELRKRALFVKDYLQIPYSKRTIFQKYVFLNPGLFMGIFTSLLLVLIAYYGISNLVGLQTPTRFESNKKKN